MGELTIQNPNSGNAAGHQTPLPKMQVFSACLIEVCEGINVNVLFPFLAFMVEDFGHSGSSLGYYAGGLAGSFCAAQFCSSIVWGWFSDNYGRKPAMFLGTLGTALGMIVFGTARSYPQAVLGRVISGFLCGNLGVVKSFLTEVTDDTNRGKAFSLFSLGWAIGTVIAPIAGGFLCKPADKYPQYFSQSGWFGYFPYLLPCLLCFVFNLIAAFTCLFCMVETRVNKGTNNSVNRGRQDSSSSGRSVEMTISTLNGNTMENKGQFSILPGDDDDDEGDDDERGMHTPSLPVRITNNTTNNSDANNSNKTQIMERLFNATKKVNNGRTYAHLTDESAEYEHLQNGSEFDNTIAADDATTDDEISIGSVSNSTSPMHVTNNSNGYKKFGFVESQSDESTATHSDIEMGSVKADSRNTTLEVNEVESDEELCCVTNGTASGWCLCFSTPPAASSTNNDGDDNKIVTTHSTKNNSHSTSNVLRQRTVVLVTLNYGILAMAYILLEETIPLFLKLDHRQGGFGFNSIQIGSLLSISGLVMMTFTIVFLPTVSRQSKAWLMQTGCVWAIPMAFAWPCLAMLNRHILMPLQSSAARDAILWSLLITVSVMRSILSCLSFTAVMLQVNHSVYDEHLGAVNGLGQSLASLSRAIGPALGGFLWSQSIKNNFVFFNFMAVGCVLLVVILINSKLPLSLDVKKKKMIKS